MTQARQILEDRINSTGVTGATVVVQGTNQLVVEIPSATETDVARLGKAAVLNFRGLLAPDVPVGCLAPKAAGGSGSASTGSSPSATPSSSASSPSGSASKSGDDAAHRPLTAPTPSSTSPKASKTATSKTATGSASASPTPSSTSTAPPPPCTADPFAAVVKA